MENKEFMIEVLKKSCGGSCLVDPGNCECFGIPNEEIRKEVDFENGDEFYRAEDCPHYDAEAWAYSDDEELYKETGFVDKEDFFKNFIGLSVFDLFNLVKTETSGTSASKKSKKEIQPEIKDKQCVYLLLTSYGTKIGKSRSPINRAKTIGVKLPFKIKETRIFPVEDMNKTELFLHNEYADYKLNGEWFNLCERQLEEIGAYLDKIRA